MCWLLCRKNLHLSEERIIYLKELSKKEAIYERLASALGMLCMHTHTHTLTALFSVLPRLPWKRGSWTGVVVVVILVPFVCWFCSCFFLLEPCYASTCRMNFIGSIVFELTSCLCAHYGHHTGWLGSRVVSMLDLGAEGPGFKSQPLRCLVTRAVHTHRASVHQAAKLVAALLRVAGVTAGLAESNGSLPPGLW